MNALFLSANNAMHYVKVEHIVFMASNNKSHFAFLRNGAYLRSKGRTPERPRSGGRYDLAELRDMLKV